jgi:hypothetical protein
MNNLIWIGSFTIGLSILAVAVSVLLSYFKVPEQPGNLSDGRPQGKINRRKIKTNPNIVCGFPVYQKAREEAPFF